MKVKIEIDVTPEQRAAIGRALGTWKPAPEEGVRVWAGDVLAGALEQVASVDRPHSYVSTACLHGECGACRNTCKYCDAPCSHSCHPQDGRDLPVPWTDQAREIALALLGELSAERRTPELWRRIATDPDLLWLRGEAPPPGEWREPLSGPDGTDDPECE